MLQALFQSTSPSSSSSDALTVGAGETTSVAIWDIYPGSRIQQLQKRRKKKSFLPCLFCSHTFYKIKNYFIFEQVPVQNKV
jgi:hypothetical protein